MRIDRIELIGFKSFADKTTFQFHPGITCIVGPNGCGKSNIVDAFRWVLGEQSAKSLRGEKMEEVIFNGSSFKKPKGMAEVTMVISGLEGSKVREHNENGEGVPDIAYITRRVYRSGESEYILNKNQVRLKDIKDLFLDTGLGVKSYSILEQEKITNILNAKPQDRRPLIEEIAGVMKYNVRKKEAQTKLESSRANLQRINDIIGEVKKQINFLNRLAKKAERYKRLSSEINAIELKIAKRDYQTLKDSFEDIISQINVLKEEESTKKAELSRIENQTVKKRIELLDKEKELEQIQTKFQNLEKEIAEIEKNIAVAKTEKDNSHEYLKKLYQQSAEISRKKADLLIKEQGMKETLTGLLEELENQKEILDQKNTFIQNLNDVLTEKQTMLEDKRKEVFRTTEEVSRLKNIQSKLRSSLDELSNREELSLKDSEDLRKAISETDASINELELSLLKKNEEIVVLNKKKVAFEDELSKNKGRLEGLRDDLSRKKEELASDITRIESLKEILFEESTKDLLSENPNFTFIDSISDVIEVDGEYERAIESALSEKVNSFIISSNEDIVKAALKIKERKLSRTAFIPRSPVIYGGNTTIPEESLGSALNFIRTKEEFFDVARCLFENIFIVRDLKTALDLVASGQKVSFVTLDGEVVEPTGVVIAGEIKGVFKKKREIRELEAALSSKKINIQNLQSEVSLLQQMISIREKEIRDLEASIVELEKEISRLRLTIEKTKEDIERRQRKLTDLTFEIEQIAHEKESIQKMIDENDAELNEAESKRRLIESQSESLKEEISEIISEIEERRAEITDIRLSIASLKERIDALHKEIENLNTEKEDNSKKMYYITEEISSVKTRVLQNEREIGENEKRIQSLVSVVNELRINISEKKEIIDNENQELFKNEQEIKLLRSRIESVTEKISQLDIQRAEHRVKMENLANHVKQNYGLDIDIVEVEPLTSEDETRIIELKEKVKELGPVNLGTLEEYEELRSRYNFLKTQQEDLIKSIEELEEAITKINMTTRRKLRESFDLLKTKFSEVFSILFGGGRAELILTDESNILETGIDIVAQPPGKKLQNINLLSGGEKTLTVLSLLFASFLIKPTPLCILDEADSALDEMNTERFANMLRELSKDTQFIVVTHNRNTINISDYIYGVTMEEAGVSKVISMQLIEA